MEASVPSRGFPGFQSHVQRATEFSIFLASCSGSCGRCFLVTRPWPRRRPLSHQGPELLGALCLSHGSRVQTGVLSVFLTGTPGGHGRVLSAQRSFALWFVLPICAHTVGSTRSRSMTVREVLCYWGWKVQLSRPLPTPQLARSRHCCTWKRQHPPHIEHFHKIVTGGGL